jgi:hypothetical protein
MKEALSSSETSVLLEPHFVRSQKTPFFIVTAMKISNLTYRKNKEWSSWRIRRVALVRTGVSGELSASFIRVTRIGELGTTLGVTNKRRKLRRNKFLRKLGSYKIHTA